MAELQNRQVVFLQKKLLAILFIFFFPLSEIKWHKPSSVPFSCLLNVCTRTPSVLSGSPTFVLTRGNSGSSVESSLGTSSELCSFVSHQHGFMPEL